MKKLLILLMSGVILGAGYTAVKGSINKQEQKQLDQFKEQKNREEELSKLQNPIIVLNELKRVGKLTVLEGQMQYGTKLTDKGFMDITLREITLDMWYQFGLGIDTQYIKVKQITNDGTVILQVPKIRVGLQYIQLNQDRSRVIDGKKMILVSQFKPSEVETVIEQSQQEVVNKIGNNRSYYDKAMSNLKLELTNIIKPLGFKNVQVEEV